MQLAAAGIGRLVLAHAGNLRLNDLNRQLLMTTDWVGKSRVESARRRLLELNPHVEIEIIPENVSESNVAALIGRCDVVVSAAPLFSERFLLNREAVRQQKPLVDCAMYELEGRLDDDPPRPNALPELPVSRAATQLETRVSRLQRRCVHRRFAGCDGGCQGGERCGRTARRSAPDVRLARHELSRYSHRPSTELSRVWWWTIGVS